VSGFDSYSNDIDDFVDIKAFLEMVISDFLENNFAFYLKTFILCSNYYEEIEIFEYIAFVIISNILFDYHYSFLFNPHCFKALIENCLT
jgi:hypothetical protein